jgi:hypothetical protein
LLLFSSYLPLGVPNWVVILPASSCFSGAIAGKKKTSARGVSHAHPLLCFFVLLYFIFACIVLSKIQKK